MSGSVEHDLLPDYHRAMRGGASRFAFLLSSSVAAIFVTFVVWAQHAKLDEVTRGDAHVVPSSKVQVVQNLEGGILSEMLVTDGQVVQKGDVLLRISNSLAQADYRDSRMQYLTLEAAVARLEAELNDTPLVIPKDVVGEAPDVAANANDYYDTQITQLKSALAVLNDQLTQRGQEILELRSKEQALARSLDFARQEKAITGPLVEKGSAPRIDLIHLDRSIADLDGQLASTRYAIPRAEAARDEVKRKMAEKIATFRADISSDLNKRRTDLAAITEKITAEKDRVTRTEVRSPVRGTIKDIKVNTIGGVIRPGQDLIEIVPLEDTLLVEAKVRPSDIAFLRPGQPAMVKVSAYDFSIYGGLKAHLEQISADAIKEEKGDTFFRVTLRTDKNHLGTDENPLPIIPGMTASAEILTGQKTVLDYLLKPILKARDRALHER